tara:strand:+ start:898 stop:1008 length:111 start_codon:yes stop_codon:yes gene_type:complete
MKPNTAIGIKNRKRPNNSERSVNEDDIERNSDMILF